MEREEEKLTHTKHRALKNQNHIVRVGKKQQFAVSYLWKRAEIDHLYFWGTIHISDN